MASFNKKVVIGVDFSWCSKEAFEYALDTVKPEELIAVFAQDSARDFGTNILADSGIYIQESITKLQDEISKKVNELFLDLEEQAKLRGVILHRKIAIGDPRNAILDVAEKEKANLIVVGSHGYSTLKRILLGSVSSWVVQHSSIPVLVVKSSNPPPEEITSKGHNPSFVPLKYWVASQL